MLTLFIEAYPWVLTDSATPQLLERLRGEVGATGISLWAASPPIEQLRGRDLSPRLIRSEGGLHFHPRARTLTGTRCQPVHSEWAQAHDDFVRLAEPCTRHALALRIMFSAAATGRLARRYPEFAAQNALGNESSINVCLNHPEVVTYLEALLKDACASLNPSAIVLTDFTVGWLDAYRPGLRVPLALAEPVQPYLAICFCRSCRQHADSAGIPASQVQAHVRTMVERFSEGAGSSPDRQPIHAEHSVLMEYLGLQRELFNGLFRRLADTCPCELILSRSVRNNGPVTLPTPESGEAAAVLTEIQSAEQLATAVDSKAKRNELRVPASLAIDIEGRELVTLFKGAAEFGVAGFSVDNLGLLPDASLTHVRQAIRFARRSSH